MNVYFDLSITPNGVLLISDTTQSYDEYLPEDSTVYITLGRFKYTETYTVNVIKYVATTETKILDTIITPHLDEEGNPVYCDEAYYALPKDGHYIIDHLIIPSVECVLANITPKVKYDRIYATDGTDFYKITNGELEKCSITELTESNAENTTLSKSTLDTFSIYLLNKKYLELCNLHLRKLMKNLCAKDSEAHDIEIDLIWMSINAIRYNVEFGMLNLAQSLLEEIYKCSGIYKLGINSLNNTKSHGCKCCL